MKNIQQVSHSGCTNLNSHQQCTTIPFSPGTYQNLLFVVLLMTAILTDVQWYLTMVLICVSIMIIDTEHLFMCLLAICKLSLEKRLLTSSAHLRLDCLFFSCWAVTSSLWVLYIISHIKPLVEYTVYKYNLSFSRCCFCFVDRFLQYGKACKIDIVHLFICAFVSLGWGDIKTKQQQQQKTC